MWWWWWVLNEGHSDMFSPLKTRYILRMRSPAACQYLVALRDRRTNEWHSNIWALFGVAKNHRVKIIDQMMMTMERNQINHHPNVPPSVWCCNLNAATHRFRRKNLFAHGVYVCVLFGLCDLCICVRLSLFCSLVLWHKCHKSTPFVEAASSEASHPNSSYCVRNTSRSDQTSNRPAYWPIGPLNDLFESKESHQWFHCHRRSLDTAIGTFCLLKPNHSEWNFLSSFRTGDHQQSTATSSARCVSV